MTTEELKIWNDGKSMYTVLCRDINKTGTPIGLKISVQQYKELARHLDLTVAYVRKRVEFYLWN